MISFHNSLILRNAMNDFNRQEVRKTQPLTSNKKNAPSYLTSLSHMDEIDRANGFNAVEDGGIDTKVAKVSLLLGKVNTSMLRSFETFVGDTSLQSLENSKLKSFGNFE